MTAAVLAKTDNNSDVKRVQKKCHQDPKTLWESGIYIQPLVVLSLSLPPSEGDGGINQKSQRIINEKACNIIVVLSQCTYQDLTICGSGG